MKKIFTLLLFMSFIGTSTRAQYVNIPDFDFSNYLQMLYPGCFNGNGQMDTTCTAITSVDSLNFSGSSGIQSHGTIASIDGIQYFDQLRYLNVAYNDITTDGIPALPASLQTFICGGQGHIDITLTFLIPTLYDLPSLPAGLRWLNCSNNNISGLPLLPAGLQHLECANEHTTVDGGPGGLVAIPLLTHLPNLPSTLKYLNCSSNSLTVLPALPASLEFLDCSSNAFYIAYNHYDGTQDIFSNPGLTTLPTLPSSLIDLNVGNNGLIGLPPLPSSLAYLNCFKNPGLTCLPHLPLSMGGQSPYNNFTNNLAFTYTGINCLPNYVPGIRPQLQTNYCNAVNNINGCQSNPLMTGIIFYDINSNGIQDPGELTRESVGVHLGNGMSGYSDINGNYALTGEGSNNILTVEAPPFYTPAPTSFTYQFTTYDTIVHELVALQPNTVADSTSISISPWTVPRPGFAFSYNVKYENVGTTVVNPAIVINYDNFNLVYTGSSNPSVINNGSSLSLGLNNVSPGTKGVFTIFFTVNGATPLGSDIHAIATATAGTRTCTDSTFSIVQGSLDPNDKQATSFLTTQQVNSGGFINYLIRFQNTGTDTAFNIIITDTLSTLLLANSFEMIASSHPCKATRLNDTLSFEFLNILLPDKNINEPLSHGYIRFRIKPKSALPNNTIVINRASIYFDYNSPVLTGAAQTTVNLATLPLTLLDFNGIAQPENKLMLYWKTANEVNTFKFDIEEGTDGRKFSGVGSVPSIGSGDHAYSKLLTKSNGIFYYRLKIYDIDGRFYYSPVIKISNEKNKAGFVLLNNPVKNEIDINLFDKSLVNTNADLINSQGMIVKSFILLMGVQQINIENLAAGVYFIRTKNGSEKIVISR